MTTPPFLTDRRIVVVRDAGRLVAAEAGRIVLACLDDPIPGVVLVVVAGGGTIPAALVKAVERLGSVIDTSVRDGSGPDPVAGRAPPRRARSASTPGPRPSSATTWVAT